MGTGGVGGVIVPLALMASQPVKGAAVRGDSGAGGGGGVWGGGCAGVGWGVIRVEVGAKGTR